MLFEFSINVKWVVGIIGRQYVFVQYIWGWNKNRKYKITKKCKIITKKYKIQRRGVKLDNNNLSRDVEKIKLSELDQVHLACRTQRWKGSEGDDEKRWKMVINGDKLWEKWWEKCSGLVRSWGRDIYWNQCSKYVYKIQDLYKIYIRII